MWIVLKRQEHLQAEPRNCQRLFKWSTSLMQKNEICTPFQIESEYRILVQGQLLLVYN